MPAAVASTPYMRWRLAYGFWYEQDTFYEKKEVDEDLSDGID